MAGVIMALVLIAALVPIGLYLLIIANVGDRVASWRVRVTRPLWLMLLLSPGIAIGHGIGVLPMFMMLIAILDPNRLHGAHGEEGRQLALNLTIWLVNAFCGFLAELWVARRRARQREDASDTSKQLSESPDI